LAATTHHAREPLGLDGGTTFTFVTDGIEPALGRARQAAGARDVSLAGGANVAQQHRRYCSYGSAIEGLAAAVRCLDKAARASQGLPDRCAEDDAYPRRTRT
jgi:hypothetical protein